MRRNNERIPLTAELQGQTLFIELIVIFPTLRNTGLASICPLFLSPSPLLSDPFCWRTNILTYKAIRSPFPKNQFPKLKGNNKHQGNFNITHSWASVHGFFEKALQAIPCRGKQTCSCAAVKGEARKGAILCKGFTYRSLVVWPELLYANIRLGR